ncbi:hypothetical protein G6704_02820 [Polynucleobacter paneuropaeus]|nr:hypothetical protein G6704_02820 [Polynucleobacter paneuropaeus]
MIKYRRDLIPEKFIKEVPESKSGVSDTLKVKGQNLIKLIPLDTPQIRAAINLVYAAENNEVLDPSSLKILAESFSEIFGGRNPTEIFQIMPLGFRLAKGRPQDHGIKSCDVVTAVFELFRRKHSALHAQREAIAMSKKDTIASFDMEPIISSMRKLNRDLAQSDLLKNHQSDEVLEQIIFPYRKKECV